MFLICRYIQNIIFLITGNEVLLIKDFRVNNLFNYKDGFLLIFGLISFIYLIINKKIWRVIKEYKKITFSLITLIFLFVLLIQIIPENHKPVKVLIIGLDGGEWDVINPLIQQGRLPNLKRLIQDGSYGNLRSLSPSRSSELWTSISSGKVPQKHGIVGWEVTREQIKTQTLWDILENEGYSIGIFYWLVTWPPRKINGFMVPGWLSQDYETYPKELLYIKMFDAKSSNLFDSFLIHLPGYIKQKLKPATYIKLASITLSSIIHQKDEEYIWNMRQLYKFQDIFSQLLAKYEPEIAAITFYGSDRLSHNFWKYREPEKFENLKEEDIKKYHSAIDDYYIAFDESLGNFLKHTNEDSLIVIVSDHGFKASSKEEPLSGTHDINGIIIIKGKDIKKGQEIKNASILDVCPTILYWLNLPLGKDMDGKVLIEAIETKKLKRNPIKYIKSYDKGINFKQKPFKINEQTRNQLKSLGYLN